jgi:hypothetical protein
METGSGFFTPSAAGIRPARNKANRVLILLMVLVLAALRIFLAIEQVKLSHAAATPGGGRPSRKRFAGSMLPRRFEGKSTRPGNKRSLFCRKAPQNTFFRFYTS